MRGLSRSNPAREARPAGGDKAADGRPGVAPRRPRRHGQATAVLAAAGSRDSPEHAQGDHQDDRHRGCRHSSAVRAKHRSLGTLLGGVFRT